ncbi:MAG: TM2 domain-containing protein [Bacteroidetes bacterium]|nr:TM2 domain-containing protein [Bacteroidota bacterium]
MISVDKDKTTAGLLGIFLGSFGIHRAYSDSPFKVWGVYAGVTVGSIVCGTAGSFVGCPFGFLFTGIPGIIGLVDGIIILSGEDSEYRSKWIGSNKLLNW